MLVRISDSTPAVPARPRGCGAPAAHQPDGGGQSGAARHLVDHLRLDRPRSSNDKTSTDQGRNQGFPGGGLLVSEHHYEATVVDESLAAAPEGQLHSVLVGAARLGTVTREPTGLINEFTIPSSAQSRRVPFGPQGTGEGSIRRWRQSGERAAQPDVEEVHEVRVRDGIVVGRIGANEVGTAVPQRDRALCSYFGG